MSTCYSDDMNTPEKQRRAIAAMVDFGTASARKSGRNPKYPYVPIIKITPSGMNPPRGDTQTRQALGRAFETRDEAVAYAAKQIAAQRASLARRLAEPRNRALREQYGLPRELAR